MVNYLSSLMALLFVIPLVAQNQIAKSVNLSGVEKIEAEFQWGDVSVRNYEGTELRIEGTVSINQGEDDDAFLLDVTKEGDLIKIVSTVRDWKSLPQFLTIRNGQEKTYIKVGDSKNVDWRKIKQEYGDVGQSYSLGAIIDIDLTVLVPEEPYLELKSEYGSLEVVACKNRMELKSIYGHLIADLSDRDKDQDCNLESTYSFVDVTLPEASNQNITLETNHGEIYSDLDIDIDEEKSVDKIFESKVIGALNRGGTPLHVKATYNNIYLRKKT